MSRKKSKKASLRTLLEKRRVERRRRTAAAAGMNQGDPLFDLARESSPQAALEIYQGILESTQPAIAAAAFDGELGCLWDQPEARRHLRALFGLASSLWLLDARDAAAQHFGELLRLDREDRQLARYWLAACLLDLQRHDELAQLLESRPEDSSVWLFAAALLAFRQHGDDDAARQLLERARHSDDGFLAYLLGSAVVDARRAVRYDGGRDEAAHSCARLFLPAWRATPGAASWARRALQVPLPSPQDSPDCSFPRDELRGLQRRRVTWQVGLCPLHSDTEADDEPASGVWLLAVANVNEQEMRLTTVIEDEPTPAVVWQGLLCAFRRPMEGEPHRPERLVVSRQDLRRAWGPPLDELGVECVFEEAPQPIGQLLGGLAECVRDQNLPQLDENLDATEFTQSDAVWQADFFRSPHWVSNDRVGAERPWCVLVLDEPGSTALCTQHVRGQPTPDILWEYLLRTMAHPGPRPPERPRMIELADSDCYDFLRAKLESIGVGCVLRDQLDEFDEFCARLARGSDESGKCALADGPGVTREQMEEFYDAAAEYFRKAPWRYVPGEVPIAVQCRGLQRDMGTRYAIVMGRTGVQMGLALYDNWRAMEETMLGLGRPQDMEALTVCYDEPMILAAVDLQLVERNGWPIAAPEAYPAVMRLAPGAEPRSATADELRLLDACLRAMPDFVNSTASSKTYEFQCGARSLNLRLSWETGRRS